MFLLLRLAPSYLLLGAPRVVLVDTCIPQFPQLVHLRVDNTLTSRMYTYSLGRDPRRSPRRPLESPAGVMFLRFRVEVPIVTDCSSFVARFGGGEGVRLI